MAGIAAGCTNSLWQKSVVQLQKKNIKRRMGRLLQGFDALGDFGDEADVENEFGDESAWQ